MKLIGSLTSPYTRKARLVLLEKGIPHEFVIDPPYEPGSKVTVYNPLNRIPALVLDNGECIFDSVVICEYADTLNAATILIPYQDAVERMQVRRGEAMADGIMDSAVAVRMERIRPLDKVEQATIDLHNDIITRTLAHIATQIGEREWWIGKTISLADLALVAALIYLDLRQPERDWRTTHPNLAHWYNRVAARPSVKTAMTN